jgi:hypothetical protein
MPALPKGRVSTNFFNSEKVLHFHPGLQTVLPEENQV